MSLPPLDKYLQAFLETLLMAGASSLIAIVAGLALAIVLHTTAPGGLYARPRLYRGLSAAVNIGRAIPFIILLLAAVYALSMVLVPWLAALIVGAVTVIIGFIMLQAGKKQFEPAQLTPDRTLHALQQDKDALKRKLP